MGIRYLTLILFLAKASFGGEYFIPKNDQPLPALNKRLVQDRLVTGHIVAYTSYLQAIYLKNATFTNPKQKANEIYNNIEQCSGLIDNALYYVPSSITLWQEYGNLNLALKKYSRALKGQQEIVKLQPTAINYFKLAGLYELQDKVYLSQIAFKKSLLLSRDNNEATTKIRSEYIRFLIQNISDRKFRRTEILKTLIKELDLLIISKPSIARFMEKAIALSELGRSNEVIKAYNDAIKFDPNSYKVRIEKSIIHINLGQKATLYGKNKIARQNYTAAAKTLLPLTEQFHNNPLINNHIAYALAVGSTNMILAQELAKKALKAEPKNAIIIDTLGWVLYKQGQYSQALAYLLKAQNLVPDNAIILFHLAQNYIKLEQYKSAQDILEHLANILPNNQYINTKLKTLYDTTDKK